MTNDFERLYDEIITMTGNVESYCSGKLMTGPEEEKWRYRELMEASSRLHNVAHELEEHLAWD